MCAFNTVESDQVCPDRGDTATFRSQFKYGDTWQYEYVIGDGIRWGGNDIGAPGTKRVVVDGVAEPCPLCGFGRGLQEDLDHEVWLEDDRIAAVRPASGRCVFAANHETYIVLEG